MGFSFYSLLGPLTAPGVGTPSSHGPQASVMACGVVTGAPLPEALRPSWGVGAGSMPSLGGCGVGCWVWDYPLRGRGVMVVVWLGGPARVPQAWATSAPLRHRCRPAMPLREGVGATRYGNPGWELSFFFHRKNNEMGWSQAPGVVYCQD